MPTPKQPDLHVYTSEDVDRMIRAGSVDLQSPNRPPAAPASPPLDYATPKPKARVKPGSSRAIRITRIILLVAYPLFTLIAMLAFRLDSATPAFTKFILAFLLLMIAPALLGTMLLACCFQFYFLSLFERKRMPDYWNIPLSIMLGPVVAFGFLRVALPICMLLLGKT